MQTDDLPLLELFESLRKSGLPLGVGEYRLLIRSLQGGFGVDDREALARLCRTLWVKSPEEEHIFEFRFAEFFAGIETSTASADGTPKAEPKPKGWFRWMPALRPPQSLLSASSIGASIIAIALLISLGLYLRQNQPGNLEPEPAAPVEQPREEPSEAIEVPPPEIENVNPEQPLDVPTVMFWGGTFTSAIFVGTFGIWLLLQWIESRRRQRQPLPPDASPRRGPTLADMTQSVEDPVELAQTAGSLQGDNSHHSQSRFLKPTEFFPITRRQMKQSWRYLRRPVREGPRTELDIQATVEKLGRQGFLLAPVLVPGRVNQTELLLLSDREGSMVPFHGLPQRFVDTALQAGRLGATSLYYFYNCPTDYLYKDPYCLEAESIDLLINHKVSKRTVVMILSDGGAARGGFNPHRLAATQEFLERLNGRVRYVAWLNPMPQSRWANTTASAIAQQVPMLEVSRTGFQRAIDILRGR
ncbi:hypothetical protein C7271_17495 [filamentous cyanobacterium CCP5]|nr:hypothetical protein C7271_17495 [filamentous cyanobacterium CCP5]